MNCKEIKELLITDYSDGQLSGKTVTKVDEHLSYCETCRDYASTIKRTAFEPFNGLQRGKPSADVWLRIKNTIDGEQKPKIVASADDLWNRLKNILKVPRFAYSAGSFAIILLAAVIIFQGQDLGRRQAVQFSAQERLSQIEHLTQLASENGSFSEEDAGDYGDAIEKFFLSKK